MEFFQGSQNLQIQNLTAYQHTLNAEQRSLFEILRPIDDASHTRDRKRSPPDSACFPGTRLQVVRNVNTWARSDITTDSGPHMRWLHGYVGSGKSSISQEVCDTSEREDRPVISFFFFRNAGDRSKIWRLATTLASQMAAVIPQTQPFIREAVQANAALLAPDEGGVSIRARMQRLVYAPFKAVVQMKKGVRALTQGPFLMVLDGLDECDNKDEVQELIDGMLAFFNENPLIPLRVFITSRVEHIHSRLNVPAVRLDNLVDHCSDDDIATFLHILFEDGCRRNSVVRAYVQQHGEWPTQNDRRKLVEHIGGSFIFASAVFKFIMGTNTEGSYLTTPMDRLPLALKMNPGLDGLYAETLSRSKHLPYFPDIISTIALLEEPLPTSGIAELLGIHTYEVVNVLVNLQTIIQVPGTDSIPVTLCHTSLRNFLTTQKRSRSLFAHPSHHVHFFLRCLECKFRLLRQDPELFIRPSDLVSPAGCYALKNSYHHLYKGHSCFKLSEFNFAIQLCREGLALQPGTPKLIEELAKVVRWRGINVTGSPTDREEVISLSRTALELRPPPHPSRSSSLNDLGNALMDRYRYTATMANLEEAVSLYRGALELRPSPHPDRSNSLNSLRAALMHRYLCTRTMTDLEESISIHHEALELRPFPHPERPQSLNSLGASLMHRYLCTRTMADLEESISMHREALELRPFPHPEHPQSLNSLGAALMHRYPCTRTMTDLEESISMHREALELRPFPHPERPQSLNGLASALLSRHWRTGNMEDLEEGVSLHREALELRPSPHPDRPQLLNNLGYALQGRHLRTETMNDLEESISIHREALELRPVPHLDRPQSLNNLGNALFSRHWRTGATSDLEESITMLREALKLRPLPYPDRHQILTNLGKALVGRHLRAGVRDDLEEGISMHREALELLPLLHPERPTPLNNLGNALLNRYRCTETMADLEEVISLHREAVETQQPPDSFSLLNLANALLKRLRRTGAVADLEEAICLLREALDLQPSPHPSRSTTLKNLIVCLRFRAGYTATRSLSHIQDAIVHCSELLMTYYPVGHQDRIEWLLKLASLLQMRFDATGQEEDLANVAMLKEEASRLSASSTESAM